MPVDANELQVAATTTNERREKRESDTHED
jgi:hypothetical protein